MRLIRWVVLSVFLQSACLAAPMAGFRPSEPFHEQVKEEVLADGVKAYTNGPGDFDAGKKTRLIIYLLPNGNTIAQTLGHELGAGEDWHYDIQHIAAQVRLLRKLDGSQNVVVTLLEAPGRSWPKFRADHPKDNPGKIQGLISSVIAEAKGESVSAALVAHSGGGSCIIGLLNSPEPIPAAIDRIAFLDANYSYSDEDHHGEKLLAWLRGDAKRHLMVFAYDDRNVTLGGKKIVSETGGTYRATGRMMDYLKQAGVEEEKEGKRGPFEYFSFLQGRAQFYLHPNPELKILHTAMIGEMNIFLQALTADTELEGKYGVLGGPRAYSLYVSPTTRPSTQAVVREIQLPARAADAVGGAAFLEKIKEMGTVDRERAVEEQVLAGNVPEFWKKLVPITVTGVGADGEHTATYFVTPDVLAVGREGDLFRMPLTPMTAQEIARKLDCSMITRKVSNDIYAHAAVKLEPRPLTEKREAVETLYQHNQIVEGQLQEMKAKGGDLVAGQKKDVVITPLLKNKPGKVAIYGWHKLDGKAIQPLYLGHVNWYVDYSHGIRLMSNHLVVDGKEMTVGEVLTSSTLSSLLSDEGVFVTAQYPTTQAATTRN